jgi:hypothetical protein
VVAISRDSVRNLKSQLSHKNKVSGSIFATPPRSAPIATPPRLGHHTGGQAIVGSVSQSGGGRDSDENRGQPHAPENAGAITFAPGTTLPSAAWRTTRRSISRPAASTSSGGKRGEERSGRSTMWPVKAREVWQP